MSACLLGDNCAYDGLSRYNKRVVDFCGNFDVVKCCPEVLGALGCPREMCEVLGGDGRDVLFGKAKVVSVSGINSTRQFMSGAGKTLRKAEEGGCSLAILKEFSPSCGTRRIYSGKFDETTISGCGVTSALLAASGIQVIPDTEI